MLHLHQRLESPLAVKLPAEKAVPFSSQLNTIGHRILVEDQRAQDVPSPIFERLDAIISRIKKEASIGSVTTVEEAGNALERIERIIIAMNFVCSIPQFLVHSFAEGLQPQILQLRVIHAPENEIRRPHLLAHQDELFSHVDCDLSSLLYLSIADVLGLPLRMVEVPQHNFIRWRLSEDHHINWDTNYGFNRYTDNEYAAIHGVTPDLIVKGVYLDDLSPENVEGYFHFVRGITFQRGQKLPEAVQEYRLAVRKYPQSPVSYNNIAWLFVSVRTVQQIVTKEEALQLALKACEIHRTDNNLDTLACVYAEHKDFESAIRIETEAFQLMPKPDYRVMIDAFRNGKTYLDVHGG
jgi:tetratricopeptide (TPR) repeat protein